MPMMKRDPKKDPFYVTLDAHHTVCGQDHGPAWEVNCRITGKHKSFIVCSTESYAQEICAAYNKVFKVQKRLGVAWAETIVAKLYRVNHYSRVDRGDNHFVLYDHGKRID